jgi:hypothetical protein
MQYVEYYQGAVGECYCPECAAPQHKCEDKRDDICDDLKCAVCDYLSKN